MPSDLFVSYRRKDSERVLPLVQALRDEGISSWLDQSEIDEFAQITDAIRKGLSESKALLAWYSAHYPKSRPCQMELTAAFLAAQREGDPRRRVLVVNPEDGPTHIEPIELRDAQYAGAPTEAAGYAALAKRIAAHIATLGGPLGSILPPVPPSQYGLKLAGASRFVGRLPELWRLHSALHGGESAIISGGSAAGLAQVSGLGGIGKSLLAEEYALRFGAAYPGGIFWLRAFGNDPTRPTASAEAREAMRAEQFTAVAMAMGIEIKGLEPAQVEALLGAKLSQQGKPFLWVVDDLGAGLGEAVRTWLSPSPLGKTLVTTRSREYGAIGTSLPLGVLTPQEALELLCARRKPEGPDEESAARGIAEDLGHHALAVDVTGAALAAQAGLVTFAQFRKNLADPTEDELELAAELADMLPTGHERSVAATLLRSVRSLPEEGQDFLRMASLLAVAPIPPTLVAASFGRVDGLNESAAVRRAARALAAVEKASLAERAEGDARLVHTLVSRTVRFHDAQPQRTMVLRGAVVTRLAQALVEVSDVRAHQRLAAEVQHARALLGVQSWDLEMATLALRVARHDQERGHYDSAAKLSETALGAYGSLLGEQHPETVGCMNNLAAALLAQGKFNDAQKLLEHALTVCRRTGGEEHPNTLTAMNNLATVLFEKGDLTGACALQEQVLDTHRRLHGEGNRDTLLAMNNFASMLAQADYSRARALLEQALPGLRRLLGEDHSTTLTAKSNLAAALNRLGDLAGALAQQEEVFEVSRRVLGEEHPHTLESMSDLAETLRVQNDLADARSLQEQVLDTRRRVLGEEHPATLHSMNNLGGLLKDLGDLDGARALQEKAVAGRRRSLGDEHPDTLTSMHG